jgi:SAM-dependent methyltransferase
MDKHPWFRRWFGDAYKKLYPHRDEREALHQVTYLLRTLPVTPEWRILDVGCGQGRHLEILRKHGFTAVGLDLSASLLQDAAHRDLSVVRGDMRKLPFRSEAFDLVTSFFTSFGYFATFAEDVEALAQFASVLKPGGHLFLDLLNKTHLIKNLVPVDRRHMAGAEVIQRRRLEGSVVIKEIEIHRAASGGEGATVERHEERVRLYESADLRDPAARLGLTEVAAFGDETGCPYHPEKSPRMSLLFRKSG